MSNSNYQDKVAKDGTTVRKPGIPSTIIITSVDHADSTHISSRPTNKKEAASVSKTRNLVRRSFAKTATPKC